MTIYARDKATGETVCREPGKRYGDGQIDTDESPIWLLADLPEGIDSESSPGIDPEAPHRAQSE